MKYLIVLSLTCFINSAEAQRGKDIMGPPTMGHPTYPTSGQTRHRSNDMTGEDMSNSTHMGTTQSPIVPDNAEAIRQRRQNQEEESAFNEGPYEDNERLHREEGPDGEEAQNKAGTGEFDLSEKAINRKQQGY